MNTITLAQQLIRRASVSPRDAGCQDLLKTRLEALGFTCETMPFEDVTNIWATRGEAAPLVVFAGHTDVVPAGDTAAWQIPPFAGEVRDGVLHGRGAADMKGSIAAFVTACEGFVANYPNHRGRIGLLITSDEEAEARYGTVEVVRTLTARGQKIDMCLVGEPTCGQTFGDTIKVGRRGSCGGKLRIDGVQGHIAYPGDNPIHRATAVLADLLAVEWDRGNADFQPTQFQVSNIHAGVGAGNVIPPHVEIDFNLRYCPESSADAIRGRIEQILRRHRCRYHLDWNDRTLPYASRQGAFADAVAASVAQVTRVTPQRSTSGGTSDGRFIAPTGAEVVEFGPRNATIHQVDECVATADLEQLSAIYEDILTRILAK